MLLFADPQQRVIPVPPIGLERIATAIADLGHEVRIEDPFLFDDLPGEDLYATIAARARAFDPHILGLSIRNADDCVVIPDPDTDEEFVTYSFIPELLRLRTALGEAVPNALMIAGGAAFSMMPGEIMDALELPLGIVGAAEVSFRTLVERVAAGAPIDDVPGLVRRGDRAPHERLTISFLDRPVERDPRYAPQSYYAVRTQFGCGMRCSYCLIANYERARGKNDVRLVVAEVEEAVRLGLARGLIRVPVMFCDEEFNVPDDQHAIEILREIDARGLGQHLLWRAYLHPLPMSDELLELSRRTNGFLSISIDSAADPVLRRNRKPHGARHLLPMIERLDRHQLRPFLGFLFGLPGETEETIAETVGFIRDLPADFYVNYEVGARIYPGTPLAEIARQEPQFVVGPADARPIDPTVYCSPMRPTALARHLRETFADRENVRPTGPAHRSAPRINQRAYQLARAHGDGVEAGWRDLLDLCSAQHWADDWLECVTSIALWYDRQDLAAAAKARLDAVGGVWKPVRSGGE